LDQKTAEYGKRKIEYSTEVQLNIGEEERKCLPDERRPIIGRTKYCQDQILLGPNIAMTQNIYAIWSSGQQDMGKRNLAIQG
jgi:hypothetical protein